MNIQKKVCCRLILRVDLIHCGQKAEPVKPFKGFYMNEAVDATAEVWRTSGDCHMAK